MKIKTIAQDLVSVTPMSAEEYQKLHREDKLNRIAGEETSKGFHIEFKYGAEKTTYIGGPPELTQAQLESHWLLKDITGKLREVTEETIEQEKILFVRIDRDICVGDSVYEWDSGGWMSLSGRAGELILGSDGVVVATRLTRMS